MAIVLEVHRIDHATGSTEATAGISCRGNPTTLT